MPNPQIRRRPEGRQVRWVAALCCPPLDQPFPKFVCLSLAGFGWSVANGQSGPAGLVLQAVDSRPQGKTAGGLALGSPVASGAGAKCRKCQELRTWINGRMRLL